MDDTDKENLKATVDALIDHVVKFNGVDEYSNEDIIDLMYTLDEAKFVVSGIIYSNGMSICDHEKDPETGECIVEDEHKE